MSVHLNSKAMAQLQQLSSRCNRKALPAAAAAAHLGEASTGTWQHDSSSTLAAFASEQLAAWQEQHPQGSWQCGSS